MNLPGQKIRKSAVWMNALNKRLSKTGIIISKQSAIKNRTTKTTL
jgi:hypothetical protein